MTPKSTQLIATLVLDAERELASKLATRQPPANVPTIDMEMPVINPDVRKPT